MTLPNERSRAIQRAREFLQALLDPRKTKRIPKAIRQEAYWVLKHFPNDYHINEVANVAPNVFDKVEED